MSERLIPRLVIGGTTSGVGKSTIALGLMAALSRRGLTVQPYKVGPDYIDPSYHTKAAGRPSRNLDGWMLSDAIVLELFGRGAEGADIALVEGVMGLFDGVSGLDETGSTAQMAKLLDAPVLLVVDVSATARSAAAMALGYARLDPDLKVAGVILNRIATSRHRDWTKEAIEGLTRLPVLGALPQLPALELPERHLGLIPVAERPRIDAFLETLIPLVEAHLDLDRILALARSAPALPLPSGLLHKSPPPVPSPSEGGGSGRGCRLRTFMHMGLPQANGVLRRDTEAPTCVARIVMANDEAFSFYYADSLDLLTAAGADLKAFSPMHDRALPEGAQGLYIGGGFPEQFADRLTANDALRRQILEAARDGMPIYAECGGLMYLTEGIVDCDGHAYPMVGAIPGRAVMERGRLTIGYVEVEPLHDNILAMPGMHLRGHEFHCAQWECPGPACAAYRILNQNGRLEGYRRGNLLATFVHLHLAIDPSLARRFVASCARYGRC